jgi:hypothetical protein
MMYEIAVIALLAVICFLLYKLYRIKYTVGAGRTGFIPENLKKDLDDIVPERKRETEMRFSDINARISGLERRLEKSERFVEKLIEELG